MPRDLVVNNSPILSRTEQQEAKSTTSCTEEAGGSRWVFISTSERLNSSKGFTKPLSCFSTSDAYFYPEGTPPFPMFCVRDGGGIPAKTGRVDAISGYIPSSTSHPGVSFSRLCSFGPTETASKEVVWPTYGGSGYLFPPQRAAKEDFGEFPLLARVEGGRLSSSAEAEPMRYPQVCWQGIQRPMIYQNPLYPSGQVMLLVSWSAGDQSMARGHQVCARKGKQRTRVEHAFCGTPISRKQPRQTTPRAFTTSR